MDMLLISDVGYQIEYWFFRSCPMLLHDEMQATLYRRQKVSFSDPLSPGASSCSVRVLVIV